MFVTLIFLAAFYESAFSYYWNQEPLCQIEDVEKDDCGYFGISEQDCTSVGCCYDVEGIALADGIPACYFSIYPDDETDTTLSQNNNNNNFQIVNPIVTNPVVTNPVVTTLPPTTTTTTTPPAPTTTSVVTTSTSPFNLQPKLNLLSIVQMKLANVSQEIINSLIADDVGYPKGALLYAMRDGKLDYKEWIKLSRSPGLKLNPVYAQYLAGNNLKGIIFDNLAKAYGVDPTLIQLLMTDNKEPVIKHVAAKLSAQNNMNEMTSLALTALTAGGKVTSDNVKNLVVDKALQDHTLFSREAVKAIVKGDKNKAFRWAFLAANEKRIPLTYYYPKHQIAFAYLVDSQKLYPDKVQPSVILALALNESVPGINNQNKTFLEMFGVKANNYVCYSHEPAFRVPCRKLQNRLYPSALECLDAGCCAMQSKNPKKDLKCFENLWGKIGVGLAQRVWNEDYIIRKIFGGKLPTLQNLYPSGIPWLPIKKTTNYSAMAHRDPDQPDWLASMTVNGVLVQPYPTKVPAKPDKFNSGFVWKPHSPTTFPTLMPDGAFPAVTNVPGVIHGSSQPAAIPLPSIFQIPPFPTIACKTVRKDDRRSCMPNSAALLSSGKATCQAMDCCYDPVWGDLGTPACFRTIDYGQCYNLPLEKRRDCGKKGITKNECLSNPLCCYDSSINLQTLNKTVPWCYYKLHSIADSNRCSSVPATTRTSCFPDKFNSIISKETCENVGCCYEKTEASFFYMTLTKTKRSPTCYKLPPITLTSTDPPPTTTTVVPAPKTCTNSLKLNPTVRSDCGAASYFTCVYIKRCCFKRELFIPGAPWCFHKS